MERQQLQVQPGEFNNSQDVQEPKHEVHPGSATYASSPSQEFSFTISLHSTAKTALFDPTAQPDLSPADDIFFRGRLLPLGGGGRLRPDETHPVQERQQHDNLGETSFEDDRNPRRSGKSKSFSLLGIWTKGRDGKDHDDVEGMVKEKMKKKKKWKFDVVKKYMRSIKLRPGFLTFGKRRGKSDEDEQHEYSSYSGNLMRMSNKWREELSAPVTMRASPANLVDSGAVTPTAAAKSDSTMEELQAAIQAAIAHCKNSYISAN